MYNRVSVQEENLNGREYGFLCLVRVSTCIFWFGYISSFDGTIQKVGIFLQSYVARGARKIKFSSIFVIPHFTDGKRDGVIEILVGEIPKHAAYCIHARVLMLGFTNLFDLLFPIVRQGRRRCERRPGVSYGSIQLDLRRRIAQTCWTASSCLTGK